MNLSGAVKSMGHSLYDRNTSCSMVTPYWAARQKTESANQGIDNRHIEEKRFDMPVPYFASSPVLLPPEPLQLALPRLELLRLEIWPEHLFGRLPPVLRGVPQLLRIR